MIVLLRLQYQSAMRIMMIFMSIISTCYWQNSSALTLTSIVPVNGNGIGNVSYSSRSSLASSSALYAKKKKKKTPKAAALEALEQQGVALWDDDEDDNNMDDNKKLSKKEILAQMKQKQQGGASVSVSVVDDRKEEAPLPTMSKKEARLAAMLALEEIDSATDSGGGKAVDDPYAGMSKKEIKAAKKAEEKKAKKMAEKAAKKSARKAEMEGNGDGADIVATAGEEADVTAQGGESEATPAVAVAEPSKKQLTMEERIRKDRPPPRIKVMEGVQPGYVSLRLENVAVTFRNQEVLKDVTWGVQTGDRVGLVGANGGGKTTQLKILNGDIEPTTGDVLKSSKDLRVALLRQEFVDELILDRTLKEEFMSVFLEEAQILNDLRQCELALENVGSDTDKMQDILDRMQKLQAKADSKEVYNLESRVEKIMNLMGYMQEEGSYPVRSFSGGWKMRIGLGKVLLQDPNILLLDEVGFSSMTYLF